MKPGLHIFEFKVGISFFIKTCGENSANVNKISPYNYAIL
jgi:hypothetical protein